MPEKTSTQRIADAYIRMAQVGYRPAAPGDGVGSVNLTPEQLSDTALLSREADHYARQFQREENALEFFIGCSQYSTNQAFVFAIEAARCLAGGGDLIAYKLLDLALDATEKTLVAKSGDTLKQLRALNASQSGLDERAALTEHILQWELVNAMFTAMLNPSVSTIRRSELLAILSKHFADELDALRSTMKAETVQ